MTANDETRVRRFIHGKVAHENWSPLDAAAYGADRHIVDEFRASVMFARLCADDPDRERPEHLLAHRCVRVKECVGPGFIDLMARKMGFSEHRAQYLIDQLDAETSVAEGLAGAGGE